MSTVEIQVNVVTIRFPSSLLAKLAHEAAAEDRDRSYIIRRILEAHYAAQGI